MNFFGFGRAQTDPTPRHRLWLHASASGAYEDRGLSPAGFLNSPYHLASFPAVELGESPKHLVSTFLAHNYPRAPTAIPPNEPWSTEMATLTNLIGAELVDGARVSKQEMSGRILLARGEGVWVSGGESERGVDDRGKRLALSLPLSAASGTSLPAHQGLPPIHWEYGCTLHSVRMDFVSPHAPISSPYISIWRCLPLGVDQKPIVVNQGDGPQPVGILVAFILDATSRSTRRAHTNGEHQLYRPPSAKGVTSAMIELVRSALTVLDADGVYPTGFHLRFLDAKRCRLEISDQGANVFNGGWIKSSDHEQNIRTVFYGLPEGSGHLQRGVPLAGSASSSSRAPRKQAILRFLPSSKVISPSGLVTSVAWSVSPSAGERLLPRELGNLEELVFSS